MFTEAVLAHIIRFYGHAPQGFMGTYLEKNIQAFIEIQQAGRTVHGSVAGELVAIHEHAVAHDAGHDGQLPGAVEDHVSAADA